jgi:hypothetical protein
MMHLQHLAQEPLFSRVRCIGSSKEEVQGVSTWRINLAIGSTNLTCHTEDHVTHKCRPQLRRSVKTATLTSVWGCMGGSIALLHVARDALNRIELMQSVGERVRFALNRFKCRY